MSRAVLIHVFSSLKSPGKRKSFLFTFTYNCWGNNLLEGGLSLLGSLSEFGLCNLSLEINISLIYRGIREKWNETKVHKTSIEIVVYALNWTGRVQEKRKVIKGLPFQLPIQIDRSLGEWHLKLALYFEVVLNP